MAKPQILTDQELDFLTRPFQKSEYSKDRALELASAGCIAMITEPGDRMAGALARSLGKLALVELLIDGLETRAVVQALQQRGQLDSCQQSLGIWKARSLTQGKGGYRDYQSLGWNICFLKVLR